MKLKITIITIFLVGTVSVSLITTGQTQNQYKNLRVLPKNISAKDLNQIMVDEFQDGLGVSCLFCHSENKITHLPDYISDVKPEKQIARKMMRMTLKLNKHFFKVSHPQIGTKSLAITCSTCHNGSPRPENH